MVPERERTARQTPDTREIVRPRSRPSLAGRLGLLECAIDDRLGGDQCPTIGVEFAGKGEFLRGEAVRKAVNPNLTRAGFHVDPHTGFWQPRLRRHS